MNMNSHRIIGDIMEINYDIVENITKSPKFISKIKDKYYRYRLIKSIKSFKKKNLILGKMQCQELFAYILSLYNGKYKSILNIDAMTTEESNLSVNVLVNLQNDPIYSKIKYLIGIRDGSPTINIYYTITEVKGVVITSKAIVNDLSYDKEKLELPAVRAIKELNDTLVDIMESFLLEYLSNYKTKGYTKEIKNE